MCDREDLQTFSVLLIRKYSLKRTVIREGEAKKTSPDLEKGAARVASEGTPEAAEDDKTMAS